MQPIILAGRTARGVISKPFQPIDKFVSISPVGMASISDKQSSLEIFAYLAVTYTNLQILDRGREEMSNVKICPSSFFFPLLPFLFLYVKT